MTTFFHLPREDIVFPLIFFRLDAVATWTLRHVCVGFLKLCEEYFKTFCPSILYNELEYDSDSLQCIGRNRTCIFRALKAFQKLKHLSLYLSPPSRHSESAKLTGTNNTLLRACPSLMTCLWHTDCHLVSLKLTNIDCSGCENILSGWKRLGKRCKALRELHIENVSLFDDMCLENLTRQCTCIVQLALKTLPGVQGIYLEGLAETCSQLEVLNLSGSYNIRTVHLERTIRVCHNLKSLDLSSLFSAVSYTGSEGVLCAATVAVC